MELFNQSKGSITLNEVIYRRIQNRERQRRYRARKHLKALASRASVSNHSSQLQIVPFSSLTNGISDQVKTRVHCARDWKKEARRLHAKIHEPISNTLASNERSDIASGSGLDDYEKVRSNPGEEIGKPRRE